MHLSNVDELNEKSITVSLLQLASVNDFPCLLIAAVSNSTAANAYVMRNKNTSTGAVMRMIIANII